MQDIYLEHQKYVALGEAYSSTTVNSAIFRYHGIVSSEIFQITSFYRSPTQLVVVKRSLIEDSVEEFSIPGTYGVGDSHNTVSLGVDHCGCIHMSYNQHATPLCYLRSDQPWSISTWLEVQSMTGVYEDIVTYPTFISDTRTSPRNTSLYFLYRYGGDRSGDARLKFFNPSTKKWADLEHPLLSGSKCKPWTSGPYWNHPAIDANGSLCLSFMWRGKPIQENLVNNNHLSYARFEPGFIGWKTLGNYQLELPITPSTSEVILAMPLGCNLINQTSMALNSQNHPHIVFYANDINDIPQYQHTYWTDQGWKHRVLSNRQVPFKLEGHGTLSLPISRPIILIDRSDKVFVLVKGDFTNDRLAVICLKPPHYELSQSKFITLTEDSLGQSEPVVDWYRWHNEEILSILIQKTEQPHGDNVISSSTYDVSPIQIREWNLNNVFDDD